MKIISLLLLCCVSIWCYAQEPFSPKKLDYQLHIDESMTEHEIMSFFVLPGAKHLIHFEKQGAQKQPQKFSINQDGKVFQTVQGVWELSMPDKPGLVIIKFSPEGMKTATLNFFVMHQLSEVKKGKLNGYQIGEYPKEPYKSLDIYLPPSGFVEVTKANQNTWLSPHYQLKQFVSKQGGSYPRYVVLQTNLLRKLEFLTEAVNKKGIATNGFHIMSGYRTPYYNKLIKNRLWSRHQWGGASDIFIDENPKDGRMDDLNRDGKIDVKDARYLADLVEEYYLSPSYQPYIGGLGIYKANAAHGPFIHVDVRGFRARW